MRYLPFSRFVCTRTRSESCEISTGGLQVVGNSGVAGSFYPIDRLTMAVFGEGSTENLVKFDIASSDRGVVLVLPGSPNKFLSLGEASDPLPGRENDPVESVTFRVINANGYTWTEARVMGWELAEPGDAFTFGEACVSLELRSRGTSKASDVDGSELSVRFPIAALISPEGWFVNGAGGSRTVDGRDLHPTELDIAAPEGQTIQAKQCFQIGRRTNVPRSNEGTWLWRVPIGVGLYFEGIGY